MKLKGKDLLGRQLAAMQEIKLYIDFLKKAYKKYRDAGGKETFHLPTSKYKWSRSEQILTDIDLGEYCEDFDKYLFYVMGDMRTEIEEEKESKKGEKRSEQVQSATG
jgi:hypothetical protein